MRKPRNHIGTGHEGNLFGSAARALLRTAELAHAKNGSPVGLFVLFCALTFSFSFVRGAAAQSPTPGVDVSELMAKDKTGADAQAASVELFAAKVEESVTEALRANAAGTTYVIVMLRPVAARGPMTELQHLAAIKAKQDTVIGKLAGAQFTLRYQYKTFAGFTGVVDAPGLDILAADPDVVSIGADAEVHAVLNNSVPFINADQVHNLGVTGQGVTIAVLDTGIDTNHPDMLDNVAAGAFTFLDNGGAPVGGAPILPDDLVRRALEIGARSGGEVVALLRHNAVAMAADLGDAGRRRRGRKVLRILKHRRREAVEEVRHALAVWRAER